VTTLFHVTRHAAQILAAGFRDGSGSYGFDVELSGVFVSDQPVDAHEATGDLLIVELGDDVDLSPYEIVEDSAPPGWRHEWIVPAALLNAAATTRLATADDEHRLGWLRADDDPPDWMSSS